MGFDELWDGFEKICERTEAGEKFTRDILRYVQKRHEAELKYTRSLMHLNECFKTELEIGTMQACWLELRDESEFLTRDRQTFCEKLQTLTDSISKKVKDDKRDRALLVARGKKLVADLNATEELMKKARQKYVEARKKQDKSQESFQKAKAAGSGNVTKAQKTAEKDERKADKADNEYRISVKNLKAAQDKFHDVDIPALLRDFEAHEEKRMNSAQEYFQTLVQHQTPIGPNTSASTERFLEKIKTINVRQDLDLYVSQNRPQGEPPARITYVSYDGSVVQDINGSGPTLGGTVAVSPTNGSSREKDKDKEKRKDKTNKSKDSIIPRIPTKINRNKNKPKDKPQKKGNVTVTTKEEHAPPKTPTVTIATQLNETHNHNHNHSHSHSHSQATVTVSAQAAAGGDSSSSSEIQVKEKVQVKKEDELIELKTIYAYEATEENELSFAENETIYLIEKDDSGWWRGRNAKGETGVFPSNFVEVVGEEGGGTGTIEINADFVALYDYEAEDNTELSIKEGEKLRVLSETDGWYYGTNANGQSGNFPSNFVEPDDGAGNE